jgi:hypothetical protein
MKEEAKNDMDLLLRRLGRRDAAAVPETDHLDADELSAYAENALPVPARARYTAHLAECSRCRELVVQLSLAAGVVVASDTAKIAKPPAWRTFLAGLFTPMVLRYAAPALGLIVVAAIGFVVLRRERQADKFVTQVTNNEQRPAAAPSSEPSLAYESNASTNSASKAEGLNDKEAAAKQSPVAVPPPNAPPTVSSVEADVPKDTTAQAKPEQQTTAANEAPPPKVEPTPTPEQRQKSADVEVSKKEVREMPATAPAPVAQRGIAASERDDRKTSNFSREPTDEVRGVGNVGSSAKLKRDELSANTRSVAGRRFQKKGGVWIDTAYDSSKDVMTVTRGSEGYRTLVADEPAIKTIADEFDGEIIVVWKGHTYRIR